VQENGAEKHLVLTQSDRQPTPDPGVVDSLPQCRVAVVGRGVSGIFQLDEWLAACERRHGVAGIGHNRAEPMRADADPEDTIRFYALRLHEVGMVKSSPQKIIADGTDWRFLNELKRELKA